MFVVPGLIVVVIVILWLCARWFISGQTEPTKMVADLESGNAEVRWRAANDLTQRLKRDEAMATDPQLALRLTELLRKRLEEYNAAIERRKKGSSEDVDDKELRERRKDVQFLVACTGNFMLPTGSDLLCKVLARQKGIDDEVDKFAAEYDDSAPKSDKQRPKVPEAIGGRILLRREAVWALANLGSNLERLGKLSEERRAEIAKNLEGEVAASSGDRKHWAEAALQQVQTAQDGKQSSNHDVINALASAAEENGEDSDVFRRELIAHALNFWHGDARDEQVAERTLADLAKDPGKGKTIEVGDE
jgi:flagellum-specific peptidoglycan hydrolase FlgJ